MKIIQHLKEITQAFSKCYTNYDDHCAKYWAEFAIVPEFFEIMKEFREKIAKQNLRNMKKQVKCLQIIQNFSQKIAQALLA